MQDRPPITLKGALWHRRWLVLGVIATCLLGAAVLSLRPRVYEASAGIYLDTSRAAPGFDTGLGAGELLQHDFILLAGSRPVLLQACAAPGVSCSPTELAAPETSLAKRVAVSVYRGSSMLAVSAKSPDPAEAAALANAVAQAILDHDRAEVARLFKPTVDALQKQLTQLDAAITAEQLALQKSPAASSAAAGHQAQMTRLQAQYASTFTKLQDLNQTQNNLTNVATIVEPAIPPTRPQAPDPPRYLLAGLIAGLCLAVLLALVVERLDTRILDADGLARAAGIPVVLTATRIERRLPSPEHRPYAVALASLMARWPDARTLMVTAASARDHSDAVATGLGTVAAHAGQRVVVVQGDQHSANGHSKNGHRANGSSNGHAAGLGWLPRRDADGLTTISVASNNGSGTAAAVADVWKKYDFETADVFVLVSVPSPDSDPSALMLGPTAKRAVLAATLRGTRFQEARRTADLLRQAGIEVVGGILLPRGSRHKAA